MKPVVFSYKRYKDLREAYKALLEDNNKLAADNRRLRAKLTNAPKVAYICDGRACEKCRSVSTDCRHTQKIEHAVNFAKVQDGYYEEIERNCYGCEYFGREYENNDIRCNCRGSRYYLDVPPGEPCSHWKAKE